MKNYKKPSVELLELENADIILTSGDENGKVNGSIDLPEIPLSNFDMP